MRNIPHPDNITKALNIDARNIRNIVLMRPINSMIEFKQIIGRGIRTNDGKDYFTIFDFVKAYELFHDPEWDGPPEDPPVPEGPRVPGPNDLMSDLKSPQEPPQEKLN